MNKRWKLKDGINADLYTFSSGQHKYCTVKVRIVWSEKLGLELKHDFGEGQEAVNKASKVIDAINKTRSIDPSLWNRDFYPHKHYTASCGD